MYKIADFGFSKSQNNTETVIGTPIYMSPEIFQNSKYGFEVDMWALGVMFYMMLNKKQPFCKFFTKVEISVSPSP